MVDVMRMEVKTFLEEEEERETVESVKLILVDTVKSILKSLGLAKREIKKIIQAEQMAEKKIVCNVIIEIAKVSLFHHLFNSQ
jgi:hypothetical protein